MKLEQLLEMWETGLYYAVCIRKDHVAYGIVDVEKIDETNTGTPYIMTVHGHHIMHYGTSFILVKKEHGDVLSALITTNRIIIKARTRESEYPFPLTDNDQFLTNYCEEWEYFVESIEDSRVVVDDSAYTDLLCKGMKTEFGDSAFGAKITLDEALEKARKDVEHVSQAEIDKLDKDLEDATVLYDKTTNDIAERLKTESDKDVIESLNMITEYIKGEIPSRTAHRNLARNIRDSAIDRRTVIEKRIKAREELSKIIVIDTKLRTRR